MALAGAHCGKAACGSDGLPVAVPAPTHDRSIFAQSARVVISGADGDKAPCGGDGLPVAVPAPTHDRAGVADRARVLLAGGDGAKAAASGVRVVALLLLRGARFDCGAGSLLLLVGGGAGLCDGRGWGVKLPALVRAPTLDRSGGRQSASVRSANTDGAEAAARRLGLPVFVPAPTDQLSFGRRSAIRRELLGCAHGASIRVARADGDERIDAAGWSGTSGDVGFSPTDNQATRTKPATGAQGAGVPLARTDGDVAIFSKAQVGNLRYAVAARAPTLDLSIVADCAGVGAARADGGKVAAGWRVGLPALVAAPTLDRSVAADCAGVLVACGDGAKAALRVLAGCAAPAHDRAVGADRASQIPACTDGAKRSGAGRRCECLAGVVVAPTFDRAGVAQSAGMGVASADCGKAASCGGRVVALLRPVGAPVGCGAGLLLVVAALGYGGRRIVGRCRCVVACSAGCGDDRNAGDDGDG